MSILTSCRIEGRSFRRLHLRNGLRLNLCTKSKGDRLGRMMAPTLCSKMDEAKRKELEKRMLQMAADHEVLNDEELLELWEEVKTAVGDDSQKRNKDKEQAQQNMQSFLTKLFVNISTRKGVSQ